MKNKYFEEITSTHKNMFKALHDVFGFDFEKPFALLKHSGNITVNKALKELEAANGKTTPKNEIIILLTKPGNGYMKDRYNAAEIKAGGKINIDFRAPYGYEWRTTFDWYVNKGSFEDARKDTAGTTYILSQAAEFLSPAKPETNEEGERYKVLEVRKCGALNSKETWISNIELQKTSDHGSKETLEITGKYITRETWKPATLEEIIDKSGYITYKKRMRMKAEAKKLRAEREKAAYIEQDDSGKIKEIERLFEETKRKAVAAMIAAGTSEEIDKAAKLFTDYKTGIRWTMFSIELYKERTAGKKYSSIKASDEAYNKIMDALKANQEASKEATTANA